MEVKSRKSTSGFIELDVNEINTTIFKSEKQEAEKLITNLLSIIDDLTWITEKSVLQHVNENFQ